MASEIVVSTLWTFNEKYFATIKVGVIILVRVGVIICSCTGKVTELKQQNLTRITQTITSSTSFFTFFTFPSFRQLLLFCFASNFPVHFGPCWPAWHWNFDSVPVGEGNESSLKCTLVYGYPFSETKRDQNVPFYRTLKIALRLWETSTGLC